LTSSTKPNVLIAGVGIGGLCYALSLMQHGFSVTVLEQASRFDDMGGGLQLSANAVRCLADAGMADGLASTTPPQSTSANVHHATHA
jgi:salicylate hydroxylase